jgi:tRNA (cytidine/uridine-2'-O-)-methyltransferase
VTRHSSWTDFRAGLRPDQRLVLLTTRGAVRLPDFAFGAGDILLMGSESAGVPDAVHHAATARVRIPISAAARSLNIVTAATLALGEALRQNNAYP